MSQQVTPQADIGVLSLKALSTFSSILATLSTDDVAPAAMLQMEKLGTYFPVSGPRAGKVVDLLQRCNSVRLDRMSLAMGWRKGDSASLMSESAGGQAVALMCSCIFSLFDDEDSSTILSYLSIRLLPQGTPCASMAQLFRVGSILSSKLHALGFGNFLAEQTVRICGVYEQLGVKMPIDLLECFSIDGAVEVLHAFSRAVLEENILMRILGTSGMGYIVAIALTMFPEDSLVTFQGTIINSGPRQSIIIELESQANLQGPPQVYIEEILDKVPTIILPIESGSGKEKLRFGRFRWKGHLADQLHLHFTNAGIYGCSYEVLVACCDLLFSLPCWTGQFFISFDKWYLPDGGLIALLGGSPWSLMLESWKEVLCASPNLPRKSVECAWIDFTNIVGKLVSTVRCQCHNCSAEAWLFQGRRSASTHACPQYKLWQNLERILDGAIWSVFVNPAENASVDGFRDYTCVLRQNLQKAYFNEEASLNCLNIYNSYAGDSLAYVDNSCVYYPTELATLKKEPDFRVSFELNDGMIIFNGGYFRFLTSTGSNRPRAKGQLVYKSKKIIPSSIGEHSRLTLTVREKLSTLELGAMIHGPGQVLRIDLRSILIASIGLTRTEACEHFVESALEPEYISKVLITSVFAPWGADTKLSIAQVSSNATAQLLCCEPGVRCVFQADSCLTCAVKQVGSGGMVIVA